MATRPWNPDYTHSNWERWTCIYPAYINSRKSIAEGRRVPKAKAVDNPTIEEMKTILTNAGVEIGVENKVYPKEQEPRDNRFRGRIRVHLRKDDGTPIHPELPSRKTILLYLGESIPKLKSRHQATGQASAPVSQPSTSATTSKKSKKK